MRIDIIFDTVCPWCYIGKRRLERALRLRPRVRPDLRWRPFLLNPDMPAHGVDRRLYLERKFGSPHRVQRVFGAVTAAGEAEGLAFDFSRVRRTPSSLASHCLIRFAAAAGCQDQVVEAVFAAYFSEGRDIGDHRVLAEIGAANGLPPVAVREYLAAVCDEQTVLTDNARAHHLGVSGVPCFIFEENWAVAGAQEPETLVRFLDLAQECQPALAVS